MQNKKIITRPYNQIWIRENRVIKNGPTDRVVRETSWFREAKKYIPYNVPQLYGMSNGSYEMERINGSNFYQWILNQHDPLKVASTMEKIFYLVRNKLHKKKLGVKKNDIKSMYYLKPKLALERFLKSYSMDLDNLVINGRKMKNPLTLLQDIYFELEEELLNTTYSLIHGDLTWSNILIDDELRFYFIDPRGCFGNTELYGDIRYDVAKMYYSIVGDFDSLNSGKFTYNFDKQGHSYSINGTKYHHLSELLFSVFRENKDIIEFIHATIWLSLISHIDDEQQLHAAFCHGVKLINDLKNEEIINKENLSLIKKVIKQFSERLSIRDLNKVIWVCFGSFIINGQKKGSDIDLMCIGNYFSKPTRYVFRYKKLIVHTLVVPTKAYISDGEKRLYGGYFTGKVINPHIFLYGNKKLEKLATKHAGNFIGKFAGFLGSMTKNKTYNKSQITAHVFIAFLSTNPSFDSYLLEYFMSPNFPKIWEALCNSTVIILKNARIISNNGSRFRYLKRFKDYKEFHEERMKSAARHWSFGAVCHGNDYKFQDKYFLNAQNKMNRIDSSRKKYKEMILFLKQESGLQNVYI